MTNPNSPVAIELEHTPSEQTYLGVRPFDVGISHRNSPHPIHVSREAWNAFVREVADSSPHANGILELTASTRVRTLPDGGEVETPWCIRWIEHDITLELTADETAEFRRLATAGELAVPPTPTVRPTLGRTGRSILLVLLGFATLALIGGIVWALAGGGARLGVLGLALAAALAAGALYEVIGRAQTPVLERTDEAYAARRDLRARLAFRLPEFVIGVGVGLPSVVGIAVGLIGGDWRWAATGLVVGTALPVVAFLLWLVVVVLPAGELSSGHLWFAGFLVAVGVPGVLLGWLWSGNVWVAPIGLGIVAVLAIASAFLSSSAYLRGE